MKAMLLAIVTLLLMAACAGPTGLPGETRPTRSHKVNKARRGHREKLAYRGQ